MSFNRVAAYGAVSGLTFISLIAASYFTLAVFKRITPLQSRPLRLSHLFLKLAAPTLALGLLLFSIFCALLAALHSSSSSRYGSLSDGALYLSLVANLILISADIAITLSLYTAAIAKLYAVIYNEKWWKLLRLDAPVGGAILMILNIAVFGRRVAISVEGDFTYVDTVIQRWFPFIINGTLLLVTVGVLGSIIYSSNKLKKRGELASLFGNIPTLLYVATFVWLLRCSYAWAMDIKTIARDLGSEAELQANVILTPFLECWTAAAMVFLLAKIVRKPVWADASVHPNPIHPAVGGSNMVPQQAGYPKY